MGPVMLCKYRGSLVLMESIPSIGNGRCPVCGGERFSAAPYGWIECSTCYDFAVDREALSRVSKIPSDN